MTSLLSVALVTHKFRFVFALATAALFMAYAPPASSAEVVYALFDKPDGGVTQSTYQGIVSITVSGVGQALDSAYSDAFYLLPTPGSPAQFLNNFWNLSFSTSLLTGSPTESAINFIIGSVPAYNPTHIYAFNLDTGATIPTLLHFGVTDEIYSDNTGAYTVVVTQVAAVPEPSTWAMMILGLAGLGFIGYRRRNTAILAA